MAKLLTLTDDPRLTPRRSATQQLQYEHECLAGRWLPDPGDARLLAKCRKVWRMREWVELFRRFHMCHLKDHRNYQSELRCWVAPLLDLTPQEVTRPGVAQWHLRNGQRSHHQANKTLGLVKTLFNRMIDWGIWERENPTDRVKRFAVVARSRFVQPEEMPRLLNALQHQSETLQLCFLTMLLCGCRPGEARGMRWLDLHFESVAVTAPGGETRTETRAFWHLAITKNGLPHTVPIATDLATRLQRLPRLTAWVFPGEDQHCRRKAPVPISYSCLHKHWQRVAAHAKIPDVTLHDLRRTCASWLAMGGENIALIAKVLNHQNLQTMNVYTRLNVTPLKRALGDQADKILDLGSSRIRLLAGAVNDPLVVSDVPPAALQTGGRMDHPPAQAFTHEPADEMEWPG